MWVDHPIFFNQGYTSREVRERVRERRKQIKSSRLGQGKEAGERKGTPSDGNDDLPLPYLLQERVRPRPVDVSITRSLLSPRRTLVSPGSR